MSVAVKRVGSAPVDGMAMRAADGDGSAGRALSLALFALAAIGGVSPARGCDLCAVYTTSEAREDQTGFRVGLGAQFTYFHTLQNDGARVPNPYDEKIASAIAQLLLGYNVFPRFGLQLNVPYIVRDYRRVLQSGVQDGTVDGFGDLSLVAIGKLFSWSELDRIAHLVAFAGVKLPSGDPSLLQEEVPTKPCVPFPDPTACHQRVRVPPDRHGHHSTGPPSGVHGHDLTLGSGSVDGLIGAQVFGFWQRAFVTAFLQYAARNVGAYDYRFANDLLFGVGPGAYLWTGDLLFDAPYTVRGQVIFSGETKGNDSIDDVHLTDTGLTALYLGPALAFDWSTHLAVELWAELPVRQHNTQLQIVANYRLRGGATWRF
ncbi:MAG: hypothetical protein U0802_25060 [Candidatus Binatia bacterium]